jgi:hypothetical protein
MRGGVVLSGSFTPMWGKINLVKDTNNQKNECLRRKGHGSWVLPVVQGWGSYELLFPPRH